jgi:hypothetical protein
MQGVWRAKAEIETPHKCSRCGEVGVLHRDGLDASCLPKVKIGKDRGRLIGAQNAKPNEPRDRCAEFTSRELAQQ